MSAVTARYNIVSALFAFVVWGGWAYIVNRHAPGHMPYLSAATQGTCSLIITLFIVRAVRWVYVRLPVGRLRLLVPAVLTIAITGSLLATAHVLAGTQAVAATIALPLTVAFGFAVYTTIHIDRQRVKEQPTHE